MAINNFEELNIREELKKAIIELNYTTPTPIQQNAIPIVLDNRDVIGQAQTGTGKTAAFSIPLLEKIDENNSSIQALIMLPTRELAIQVTKEIRKLNKYLENVKVVPVYGGQSYDIQINALKKRPQIIVGTPGRLIDLMDRSLIKLHQVKMVVLDEADEMLKMGFKDDLEKILTQTPKDRQTVMFSATMPDGVKQIANKYLNNYEMVRIEQKTITVDRIDQSYFVVKPEQKKDLLIRLLDFNSFSSVIIFCNTKRDVDELVVKLQSENYMTEGLHGDLKQSQRDRVMNSFRNSNVKILVATDVAARGLDIDDVEAVFNYDVPLEDESYVHRIGRTGRAGKFGKSFTFITRRQQRRITEIEQYIKTKIKSGVIPSIEDIKNAKSNDVYNLIKKHITKYDAEKVHQVVSRLTEEGFNKDQIIYTLIDLVADQDEKQYIEIEDATINTDRRSSRRNASFDDNRSRRSSDEGSRNRRSDKRANSDNKMDKKAPKARGNRAIVHLNMGSKQNLKVVNVLDFLQDKRIRKDNIGTIEINKKETYIELLEKDANMLVQSPELSLNDKKVVVQRFNNNNNNN
jgi:ATP-dependent RNA helicase DeaD